MGQTPPKQGERYRYEGMGNKGIKSDIGNEPLKLDLPKLSIVYAGAQPIVI
jgi:hypothetical protein